MSYRRRSIVALGACLMIVEVGVSAAVAQRCPERLNAPGGAAGELFGFRVAAWGDTAIIGAHVATVGRNPGQGRAHAFRRGSSGWAHEATLTADDGQAFAYFGTAVGVWGDTAVIGSNTDQIGANAEQGSAYIFVRTTGTAEWTQQAKLIAADGHAGDNFGRAVAICGDTVVVGSLWDPVNGNYHQGSAYIFIRTPGGTGWTQQAKLTADDGGMYDAFGISVAISGETALIGAWQHTVGPRAAQGAAYAYVRSGGVWTQQARLTAPDGGAGDYFGVAVAIWGDLAIAGSFYHSFLPGYQQGCAYVYARAGTVWRVQDELVAPDGQSGDNLGYGVDIRDGVAVVGTYRSAVGSNADQGAAYVFVRIPGETLWTVQAKLVAPDGAASDEMGRTIALTDDSVFIGVPLDGVGSNDQQGSAWVFTRVGENWTGPDFNGSGAVTVQDVFDFLSVWFQKDPGADFNGSGAVTVQDIFDFLRVWFGGC